MKARSNEVRMEMMATGSVSVEQRRNARKRQKVMREDNPSCSMCTRVIAASTKLRESQEQTINGLKRENMALLRIIETVAPHVANDIENEVTKARIRQVQRS